MLYLQFLLIVASLFNFIIVYSQEENGDDDLQYVDQKTVPFILFSHKLIPGVQQYQEDYDSILTFHNDELTSIVQDITSHCSSDAYILINVPGLTKSDFLYSKNSFNSLKRYIFQSSTTLKFEKTQILGENYYDKLTFFIKDKCRIKDQMIINIRGNNTDNFQPYIDSNKRIIKINYPELPTLANSNDRTKSLEDYDKFLRLVLAQIPSPEHTVIITSLNPSKEGVHDDITPIEIFPEIFDNKLKFRESEQNNRILDVPPEFNEYRPRFDQIESNEKFLSIFDYDFIDQNKQLIISIVIAFLLFIIFQIFLFIKPSSPTKDKVKIKKKTTALQEKKLK
ncbi:hypothetical protein TBLA_0H01670 [Henningerozyma blattae CBS 6284]|uniref:Protein BIG1 n=1 Tax=Henningerozyma blattae (strain ATCC 34711 / CBS 6284 / DSM 70876 / NBRC 10599 / NRRL Y-10934 / UCD 77-7) TaxID=1071380 RepID=I2H7V2_HENB6|nr:hypothetical protein TBLA_0H01670 [Tetrapisispora blattae CBS 6284]CCH62454.1 hypothetical protein TBLA_0H01670 [Tetrapisispora blattae CBS 6284]